MLHRFSRLIKVIGEENFLDLSKKSVLVLGCGGVGGYVIEALVRSGIGTLIIVDFDMIDESNINRQIIALESTIGLKKVDVLKNRIIDINKNVRGTWREKAMWRRRQMPRMPHRMGCAGRRNLKEMRNRFAHQ